MKLLSKNTHLFKILIVTLLAAFAGCAGSRVMYVESNKLPKEDSYDILSLTIKDAEMIDLRNKNAKFHKKYKDKKSVIVYSEDNSEKIIALSDISLIKIEVYNDRGSIAIAFGGLMLIGFLIYILNKDFGD